MDPVTANPLMMAKVLRQREGKESVFPNDQMSWLDVLGSIARDVEAFRARQPKSPAEARQRWGEDPAGAFGDVMGMVGMAPLGATVYHGSPHRFAPTAKNPLGEFDATKIGSGEGAQAYGYGHYLADRRGVAGSYASPTENPAFWNNNAEYQALVRKSDRLSTILSERYGISDLETLDSLRKFYPPSETAHIPKEFLKKIDDVKEAIGKVTKPSLYKVDLADEAIPKMLDWDKPLSNQAPEVQSALKAGGLADLENWLHTGLSGREIYNRAKTGAPSKLPLRQVDDEIFAAQRLRELGIPGIRYLDQGSRAAGQGSSNYVVFPGMEHFLKILGRE